VVKKKRGVAECLDEVRPVIKKIKVSNTVIENLDRCVY
jgi:hypothetical protein